ncbi:redoxin family protein [Pasteurellaceae bacterium LIM206]|nr:redoxin family protein [Pasteurellaceae bacterium LIM206]
MKKWLLLLCTTLLSLNVFAEQKVSLKDIQLKDLTGKTVSLTEYQGKNAYVKMWASWCPICLAGLAEIDQLSAEQDKDFNVITIVSPDHNGEKSTENFVEWYKGLEYKNIIVLMDERGEVLKRARVRGYPFNLFLNAELELKKTVPGHLTADKIKAQVNQ